MAAARLKLVLPGPGSLTALQRFMLASAAGHVLLAVLVIVVPSLGGRRAPFQDVTFVDLVAAAPGASRPAARSAPAPTPPAEQPAVPEEAVRAEPEPPKPVPERVEPAPAKKPAPTKPAPKPAAPAPSSTSPSAQTRAPEADGLQGASDGNAEIATSLGGSTDGWYRSQVIAALYGQWRRPMLTGSREIHEVTVSFDILRDGRVDNLRLESSSGIPTLDRSALRAVADASPLPPIPSAWNESRKPVVFLFRLHPER